jgi:hypothetical protein
MFLKFDKIFIIREVTFYDVTSVGYTGLSCTVGMYMLSATETALYLCIVINDLERIWKEALVLCWQVRHQLS